MSAVEAAGAPAAVAAATAATAATREAEPATTTPAARGRMASDAFLAASGYHRVVCGECSAILKIPAEVMAMVKECPRCQASIDLAYPAP